MPIEVRVDTGVKSEYVFKTMDIAPNHPFVEDGRGNLYHEFGSAKPATAIVRLMESHARYKAFFDAVRKLAILNGRTDEFDGFIDQDLVDEDQQEAWELVAQMVEEAERDDSSSSQPSYHWVRDPE